MKLGRFAAFALLAALPACSDAPTPTAVRAPETPLLGATYRVTVTCPTVLYVGESGYCSAQGYDVNNNPTSSFGYFTSSNPGSVSVSGSMVTANAPGGATITGWVDGVAGYRNVNVTYVPVLTGVTVSPNPTSVVKGYTRQLSAVGYDQYGAPINGLSFTWSSANTSLATVSSSGLVTGVNTGTVTISASTGGKTGGSSVTVTNPPLAAGISGSQYVTRYQSAQYTASVSGGSAPYTYEWRTRQGNASYWGAWQSWYSTGSTNYTYASISSCGLDRNQIEVRVTDSLGATAIASYTVYVSNPC